MCANEETLCTYVIQFGRQCSLTVALSYRSRRNLSLALSVHVARVQNCIRSFNLNIRYMVGRTGHTHASRNAVTLVWGSLRLAPINRVLASPKASSYIIGLVATE